MPQIDIGITFEEHNEATSDEPFAAEVVCRVAGLFKQPYLSERGNWVIPLRFEVVDHPQYSGRSIFYRGVIGTFSWRDFCRATGFSWSGTSFDTEDLVGRYLWVRTKVESTDRGLMMAVDKLWPVDSAYAEKLSDIPF